MNPLSPQPEAATLAIPAGAGSAAYALFAYEVGAGIDLDHAQRLVTEATQRETIKHRRRTPEYFEFRPAPLRIDTQAPVITLGPSKAESGDTKTRTWQTDPLVECTLYDFGAISVVYRVPIEGDLTGLLDLADELYENAELLADSRRRVTELLERIRPAVRRLSLADLFEDYVIYRVPTPPVGCDLPALLKGRSMQRTVASLLRAERGEMSEQELADALSCVISFSPQDATIIDWNAAMVIGEDTEDVMAVLEFGNVELLEMRFMDDRLDEMLDLAYEAQQRGPAGLLRWLGLDKRRSEIRRIATLQVDNALLFEGINNALKLLGDQYLARVYRLAAQRLHLPDWDASIMRKIQTLDGIYQKFSDDQASIRMEILELIIIALFLVSIVLPFVLTAGK